MGTRIRRFVEAATSTLGYATLHVSFQQRFLLRSIIGAELSENLPTTRLGPRGGLWKCLTAEVVRCLEYEKGDKTANRMRLS